MLIVGLTGGIASGKSTVSRMLSDYDVPVICLDDLSRLVVQPGAPALEDIRRIFGDEYITEAGELNREAMAALVFNDPEKRDLLQSIIHPRVGEEVARRVERFGGEGYTRVVVDIPLLYEVKWDRRCDCVIVVYVPPETQVHRLIERDGMSMEEAHARLKAQIPIEEKRERADFVIDNSGGLDETRAQLEQVLEALTTMRQSTQAPQRGAASAGWKTERS